MKSCAFIWIVRSLVVDPLVFPTSHCAYAVAADWFCFLCALPCALEHCCLFFCSCSHCFPHYSFSLSLYLWLAGLFQLLLITPMPGNPSHVSYFKFLLLHQTGSFPFMQPLHSHDCKLQCSNPVGRTLASIVFGLFTWHSYTKWGLIIRC